MIRMYSPSPTVRSSPIPFYMRGFPSPFHLGQDPIDTTMYDPGSTLLEPTDFSPSIPAGDVFLPQPSDLNLVPSTYEPNASLIPPATLDPQTTALAQLYTSAAASGTMTPAQANSAIQQLFSASAATAKAATGLTTAPSPRVAVPAVPGAANPLTAATVIPGVPNWTLLAAAAIAALAMGSR